MFWQLQCAFLASAPPPHCAFRTALGPGDFLQLRRPRPGGVGAAAEALPAPAAPPSRAALRVQLRHRGQRQRCAVPRARRRLLRGVPARGGGWWMGWPFSGRGGGVGGWDGPWSPQGGLSSSWLPEVLFFIGGPFVSAAVPPSDPLPQSLRRERKTVHQAPFAVLLIGIT